MLAPCSTPGWREMQSAGSPTVKSSEPCCGLRNSWSQERNSSGSFYRHSQHLEPPAFQQLPRTDKSPRRQLFREALQIGSIKTFPERNIRRVHLHPDQIIHGHIRLAENRLETVKQQTQLLANIIRSQARGRVNADAPGKVKCVARQ